MKGSVSAWWINALLMTVTAFMWLSIAAGAIIGITIADAAADASNPNCRYDSTLGQYYDRSDNICNP